MKALRITYQGKTMSLRRWAKKLGLAHCTIATRLRAGWPVEKAFAAGKQNRCSRSITHAGKTQCLNAWTKETGIPATTIRHRLERGWPMERVFSPVRRLKEQQS